MGIQISGLLANQAFDWKSIVDQLIAVDSIPITKLQTDKSNNTDKITALADVKTSLQDLQDALQSIRSNNTFRERAVTSSDANTTWKSSSAVGAPVGSYKFEVQTLATASELKSGSKIAAGLGSSAADLGLLTMSSLPVASSVTAGTFTVDGQAITFAATDSLKQVLDRITSVTGDVTWSYDATNDSISLQRPSGNGPIVLGAANDSSNFLQALKLSNNGTSTTTSAGRLGVMTRTATLENARLAKAIGGTDASGNGTFSINGVPISFNVKTDTLNTVMARINASAAQVSASYDAANDRMVLQNKKPGDLGISVSESTPGLAEALNLTSTAGAALTRGTNLQYRVNGGDWIYSANNTVDSTSHGITGLSVTVNSVSTQTLSVQSDSAAMQTAVQSYIDKFNAVQDLIESKTQITSSNGSVTTSILSSNHEVEGWAQQLQRLAFKEFTGVTGSITSLDNLGIDFDGTTGHLKIKDSGKLNTALADKPSDVEAYFMSGSSGVIPEMYDVLTNFMQSGGKQQESIRVASKSIDEQITTLQARLAQERETLTNAFTKMLDAQSAAQTQQAALNKAFFSNSSN